MLPDLPRPFVKVMLRDSIDDASRAVAELDLELKSLRTVWSAA